MVHTIQILENGIDLDARVSRKKIYEFTGDLRKFNLKSFEKRIKALDSKKLTTLSVFSFWYGVAVRLFLG